MNSDIVERYGPGMSFYLAQMQSSKHRAAAASNKALNVGDLQ